MKRLAKLLICGVVLSSCVNEEYDLNNIDGTTVILKDFALPIGSLEKIMIKDVLSLDPDGTMIKADSNGDLTFYFSGSELFNESITIPSFSIPFSNGSSNVQSLTINTGNFAGVNSSIIGNQTIRLNQKYEQVLEIESDYLLPSEVIDAKYVDLDMDIDYSFSVSSGAAYVAEGFKIDFPDWMTIEKADSQNSYVIEKDGNNNNVIRFVKDTKVSADSPVVLKLKITKVVFPEGSIIAGGTDQNGKQCKKLWLDPKAAANKVVLEGDVYMQTGDFPTIPESISINMQLNFSNFDVKAANICLAMEYNYEGQTLPMIEYPDFLKGNDVALDIYDAFLRFNVTNSLPLSLEINADFEAYKNSILTQNMHLGAGALNGTSPIVIPAQSTNAEILFSKLGTGESIKLPLIGDILLNLPDKVKVSNVNVSSSQDYIDIVPGTNYGCSLAYDLYAPLAFGEKFKFNYGVDVKGIGLELNEFDIKSASLVLNVTNSIPLNFNLSAKAIDDEGQPVEGLKLEVLGNIASGVQSAPSTTPVQITLSSEGTATRLDAISLMFSATGPKNEHIGTPLNEAQGLKIDGISVRLPEGVTVDFTSLGESMPEDGSNE